MASIAPRRVNWSRPQLAAPTGMWGHGVGTHPMHVKHMCVSMLVEVPTHVYKLAPVEKETKALPAPSRLSLECPPPGLELPPRSGITTPPPGIRPLGPAWWVGKGRGALWLTAGV